MGQLRDEKLLDRIIGRIKELTEEHGVTLEQFYNDTNIHLSRIESTRPNISVSTLNAVCKYFKISLSDFFKGL